MKKILLMLAACLTVTACSDGFKVATSPLPPPDGKDGYLVVDRAVIQLTQGPDGSYTTKLIKPIFNLLIPQVYAYTGSIPPTATLSAITYNNPASTVGFTLSQATVAGAYTGDILAFGNFAITGLNDNTLNKCSTSGIESGAGSAKCTQARIRVYSATGDINGSTGVFCNATDNYCVPMTVGGIIVGKTVANAAYVQTLAIASNKNRLRDNDFTAAITNFPVAMDMSNAGSGSYSVTLIVEYVLRIP